MFYIFLHVDNKSSASLSSTCPIHLNRPWPIRYTHYQIHSLWLIFFLNHHSPLIFCKTCFFHSNTSFYILYKYFMCCNLRTRDSYYQFKGITLKRMLGRVINEYFPSIKFFYLIFDKDNKVLFYILLFNLCVNFKSIFHTCVVWMVFIMT
jgi:hypothetical protein